MQPVKVRGMDRVEGDPDKLRCLMSFSPHNVSHVQSPQPKDQGERVEGMKKTDTLTTQYQTILLHTLH